MTGLQIIEQFHRNVDDDSRLSPQQEVQLLQQWYERVCDEQDWSFLTKSFTGNIVNGETALPSDFKVITRTINNNGETVNGVLVNGQQYNIYPINFYNQIDNGPAVFSDFLNGKLLFRSLTGTVTYMYQYIPAEFTLDNISTLEPVILPRTSHKAISYGMASEFYPIDGTEQAASQAGIYQTFYNNEIVKMKGFEFKNNIFQSN